MSYLFVVEGDINLIEYINNPEFSNRADAKSVTYNPDTGVVERVEDDGTCGKRHVKNRRVLLSKKFKHFNPPVRVPNSMLRLKVVRGYKYKEFMNGDMARRLRAHYNL